MFHNRFFKTGAVVRTAVLISMGLQGLCSNSAIAQNSCSVALESDFIAQIVRRSLGSSPLSASVAKVRSDGTKIYRITSADGSSAFFREKPHSGLSSNFQHAVFDDSEMPVIAYQVAKSFGFKSLVPKTVHLQEGLNLTVGGNSVHTRPGILQQGLANLVTPIDEFRKIHPGQQAHAREIQKILNQGDWPRLYADWKIWWRIMNQTDLSIENLARQGNSLVMFDLGDLLNLPAIRSIEGINRELDNLNFNMPQMPGDRIEHRADFRLADAEFKNFARTIAGESDEATAARLGKRLEDSFAPPRGKVIDHVRAMKFEARELVRELDKGPFDY